MIIYHPLQCLTAHCHKKWLIIIKWYSWTCPKQWPHWMRRDMISTGRWTSLASTPMWHAWPNGHRLFIPLTRVTIGFIISEEPCTFLHVLCILIGWIISESVIKSLFFYKKLKWTGLLQIYGLFLFG